MIGDVRELGALLREASSVLSERFSRFLLALAEVPRIAGVYVGPLEVSFKHPDQISLVVDLVSEEFLEPPASGFREKKR
jgi:hypothetical protein